MSPPSDRIVDWINKSGFPTRGDVENYVATHGGKSAAMDASIDFVFGTKQDEQIDQTQQENVSPLESLQGQKEPTTLEELQQQKTVEEVKQPIEQIEGTAITPQEEQGIIRRLRRFLSGVFGNQ